MQTEAPTQSLSVKIVRKSDGLLLFESSQDFFGAARPHIGESVQFCGIPGFFRVIDVQMSYWPLTPLGLACFLYEIIVFVIPISETLERLPHED